MPKPGYYQFRLTQENERQIRAICRRMGIDPDERGAYAKVVNFALRLVALGIVEVKDGD